MPYEEIEFAVGLTVETQGMRVTYKRLSALPPHQHDRFPTIYKTYGNGATFDISLTPEERDWLFETLARMKEFELDEIEAERA